MSLSTLALGLFLILTGLNLLGVTAITGVVLGIFALIAGILLFIDAVRPIVLNKRA